MSKSPPRKQTPQGHPTQLNQPTQSAPLPSPSLQPMLVEVKVEDAVGMVLAHDLTQIIPGQYKGRLFKKGHVICAEDIPQLLNIGKEHIYIISLTEGHIHEDEAAERMAAAMMGEHVQCSATHEGKVTLQSTIHGLVHIDKLFVDTANALEQVVISTIQANAVVKPEQALVGTRVIPLVIEEQTIAQVEHLAAEYKRSHPGQAVVSVKPFRLLQVGLITTGGEVFSGRIKDRFGPIVKAKVAALGSQVVEQRIVADDVESIVAEIEYFQQLGVDLILVTGGMSVDPDDRTPGAIRQAGADIVSYGTPMLPGSMLLIAYLGDGTPIMGLPGCVMHDPYTSFDVLLPRICAGDTIVREDIIAMGYGGLHGC